MISYEIVPWHDEIWILAGNSTREMEDEQEWRETRWGSHSRSQGRETEVEWRQKHCDQEKERNKRDVSGKEATISFFQMDTRTDEGLNTRVETKTRDNSDDKHSFLKQMVANMVSTRMTFLSGWFHHSDIHMVVVVRIFIHTHESLNNMFPQRLSDTILFEITSSQKTRWNKTNKNPCN